MGTRIGNPVTVTRSAVIAVALCAALVGGSVEVMTQGAARPGGGRSFLGGGAGAGMESLPVAARAPVSQVLGRAARSFWATRDGGTLVVHNPSQGLAARFSRAGVALSLPGGDVRLSFLAVTYGRQRSLAGSASPSATANQVSYQRQGVDERYVNGPLGIEQSFTLSAPTRRVRRAPVTLELRVGGSLRPRLDGAGAVTFVSARGAAVLRYGELHVTDALGRAVPASMSAATGELSIRITGATHYPLIVDPFIRAAKLMGAGESGQGQFGWSVALSADGDTALVGAPWDHGFDGAAWVFTRVGAAWRQQGPKLTAADESGAANFGSSVALSADGNTALIGGPQDQIYLGAAWVFTRAGSAWHETQKLSGSADESSLGSSVSISANGNTALVGAELGNLAAGGVVFTRSTGGWLQQASLSSGAADSAASIDGFDTTLSGDGNTALVGGAVNDLAGAVWVFTRVGSAWSRQAGPLTPNNESGPAQFGLSGMALSSNGDTAVIGAADDNGGAGAAWVFTRSGAHWRQGPKLTAKPNVEAFGVSIGVSGPGNTALIGAPETLHGNTIAVGAAFIFGRSGSRWLQRGSRLTGGVAEGLGFGASVALSSHGTVALIGETSQEVASSGIGASAVFVLVPATKITRVRINRSAGVATFSFRAIGSATGFRCALVRSRVHKPRPPLFSRCRSPKTYRHLEPGGYTFLVRAVNGPFGGATPARRAFHI